MGLFRRKDERAIPKPGSKEFEEAVRGTAAEPAPEMQPSEPEAQPVEPEAQPAEPLDDQPAAEQPEEVADDSDRPDERTRRGKVLGSLGRSVLKPPNAEGFGGGIPGPNKKR